MNKLTNNFSLLELDVDDAGDHLKIAAADDSKANGDQQTSESTPVEYKMPLVWIDLEMTVDKFIFQPETCIECFKCGADRVGLVGSSGKGQLKVGLNIESDRILEIACVITDGNLTKSIEGPDLVIHQTKECLDKMGEWCQEHHSASGLTEKVLQSSITEQDAEKQVMEFVMRHVGTYTPLIAGNSIYTDLLFLKKYMPNLAGLFSHILVDVSSVKALCARWYPRDNKRAPQKENKHRAMDDIKESVAELKFYKDHIFKHKPNK